MFCQCEPGLQTPVLDLPQFSKCLSFGLIVWNPQEPRCSGEGLGPQGWDLWEPPSSSGCLRLIVTAMPRVLEHRGSGGHTHWAQHLEAGE